MKKTLALLLVASLLLAGCTELTDAVDEAGEEILNIEVDEDIALEKVEDFLTVDESESFGITVMYEIDMSQMDDGSGMLEVDEDAIITMEMTEAWSPDGYHSSSVTGMDDGDMTISMITSMTHVGTTMYMSIGYDIDGELGADATEEEAAQFAMMQAMMTEVEHFSMTTTTTHTEVIAAMAEASEEDSEDMDPMAFLEMIEMIEEYGTFTPADSADGLQMFDVAIDPAAMNEDVAAEDVLEWCDADNNGALSWSEFTSDDCDGEDDSEFETIFNDADTDMSGELTEDELPAFIEAAMALSEEIPTPEEVLDMCDTDASNGVSWDEFIAVDCDDTDSEDMDDLEAMFNQADADGSGEITMDELQGFIDSVSTFYETDMDDDMEMDEMPAMQVAFTSTGDIEYFSMEMEGTEMMMYILTEERVNALFTDLDAGETVALPFSLSYDMYDDDWDDDWGDDGDFYCNDGTTIPMDWVNDGDEDCADGEDESDMGGSDDEFMCEDGTTIPMDWVGDGEEDCANGEDETYNVDLIYTFDCLAVADFDTYNTAGFDNFDESAFDTTMCGEDAEGYMFEDTDSSLFSMPTDFVVEECEDIGEGEIECYATQVELVDQTDADGNTFTHAYATLLDMTFTEEECPGMFDETDMLCTMDIGIISDYDDDTFAIMMSYGYEYECADGSYIVPYDYINDGEEDCDDGSDESTYDETTGEETSMFTCADGTTIPLSYVLDGEDDCAEGEDEMPYMEETDWVMYQFDESTGYGLTMSIEETYSFDDWEEEEEFVCNDGTTIPMDWVNDGMNDCAEGEDEMNMDDSDETVMYVTSETGFHFEGDLSDYKIELATCESDYDTETGEETTTCTTVMSVAIADAGEDSDIMFHDADSSGTLSVGDMIHIGEVAEAWDEVRLYSISADAYSDENPMHNAPGFTGLVGMLALLGAAFIRRNE